MKMLNSNIFLYICHIPLLARFGSPIELGSLLARFGSYSLLAQYEALLLSSRSEV